VAAGVAVEVLPEPSAAVSALVASGLPPERWCFAGFLPRRAGELRQLVARNEWTLVVFESPRRLAKSLGLLAEVDPRRPVAVCRELSKVHEEVRRGSAAELAAHYAQEDARGEIVLVIGAAPAQAAERERAVAAVAELVEAGARTRAAASVVAQLTGVSANELYEAVVGGASK